MNWKAALLLMTTVALPVAAQQLNTANFTQVTITMKTEGGHCDCAYQPGSDVSCCPSYSVSLDENGNVIYNGISGVKVRGARTHSISIIAVRNLVADLFRIDFFSLEDRYTSKRLPNGQFAYTDQGNPTTISIDIDGKKKSVYIFYGEPQNLIDLQHKLYDVTKIAQYVGSA